MPTGVPILDIGPQLLDAAERLLVRDGPDALTSRAVTTEAGVAKGILHRHFADFDAFLAALVLRHLERLDVRSAGLRASAGTATVDENVVVALADVLDASTTGIISLVCCRPRLLERVRVTTPTGIPLLAEATRMIAAYLTAERGLGRIALSVDVDALAVMLVGGAYLLAGPGTDASADELRHLVTSALHGLAPETLPRRTKI